jgi:ATP-dependent DNA helicase Q1
MVTEHLADLAFPSQYFSTSASLPTDAWDDDGRGASGDVQACGHCDNCLRDPATFESLDVTVEVWRILRVCEAVCEQGGRVTVSGLAELVRGLGGGTFPVVGVRAKGKGKASAEKGSVDVKELNGGKVALSKEQTEYLLIELVLQDYLREGKSRWRFRGQLPTDKTDGYSDRFPRDFL